jgi:ankyrin repeat protein
VVGPTTHIWFAYGNSRPFIILSAVVGDDRALMILMREIVTGDAAVVAQSLAASPALASSSLRQGAMRQSTQDFFIYEIAHYLFAGDTPLHAAAAAHRKEMVSELLSKGADVRARNRRGAQPLHYAADGMPGSGHLDPNAQRDTVIALLEAGADPNATDKGGVTPLHRAVRNRCASAVRALIERGADVGLANASGSTPIQLAHWTTGRGGSGSPIAKAEQKVIVRLLLEHGAR